MKIKSQHCFYCGSGNTKAYKKIHDFTVYQCDTCGLLFSQRAYKETYGVNKEWYSDEYIANYIERRHEFKNRFKAKVHEIESMQRGGKLLDVGCGVGLFLEAMLENSKYKWELYGLDINKKLIESAKSNLFEKGINLFLGTIKIANIKVLDCITCFDVLEHDADIKLTLATIKSLLKPSGLLVVQAPNYSSLMAKFCGENWDWWSLPDHVFHFNPHSLSSIIQRQGFRIRKLYTWDPPKEFISNIQGTIKIRLGKIPFIGRFVAKALYFPLLLLWSILLMMEKRLNIGSLVVVYAES